LTPYDGSNLGDATIQTAVIENFLSRAPALELFGITLDPEDTIRRHEIPAFPITGLAVSSYSEALLRRRPSRPAAPGSREYLPVPDRPAGRARAALKALPLLGPGLKLLVGGARHLRRIATELGQLWPSLRVVRRLDLLLVSGGGQLDEEFGGPWGHPYTLFRWAILAKLTGTRIAIASVGAQHLNRPLTRFFVKTALASAAYRSYRDPGSKRQVAGWRFTEADPCVPDLAFSLRVPVAPHRRRPGEAAIVGVSPMVYGHAKHWPTKRHALYEEYSRRLAGFAHWLLDQGHTLLLFQSSGADRIAAADLKARLLELAGPSVVRRIVEPEVRTVDRFFGEVAAADYVVASRLHGVLMSHMLGKPVLAISFDRKVDAHMESMGQTQYCVDIGRFETADLITRFGALEENAPADREEILERVRQFRSALDTQFEALLDLAGAPRGASNRDSTAHRSAS
jgi:polysaccharide pyruvyl transferase WcaK-like protein